MKISREEVLRVAELAHLELSEAEVVMFQQQLDSILTYMEKLSVLDTSRVEPMAQVLTAAAETSATDFTLRHDTPVASDVAGEAFASAPDPSPPYFRVPKVIEK